MNLISPRRAALLAALAGLALASCDRDTAQRAQNEADTVGQKVDRALERTRKELAEAGRQIKPELERAGAKISQAANNAGERIKHADDKSAPAANGATPPSGAGGLSAETRSKLNDTVITASIKADYLKDPDLSVLKIDVDTAGGVVTLNGLAKDEAARKRAEQMAAAVKGVTEVRNYLTLKRG